MITERHEAFARAVAALARAHMMDQIHMSFREGVSGTKIAPTHYESVTMTWHTGRHGQDGDITLTTAGSASIPEKAP